MRKKLAGIAAALAAIILVTLPMAAGAQSDDSSRINRERLAIGRALIEVQSTNWPSVLPYYADDIEYQDPIVTVHGIGMMTEFLARLFASTPDLVTAIEDEICVDDVYTATWTMYGQFNGVPYEAKGVSVMKFRPRETQVYFQKDYYTEGDIMINIPGLDEPTAAFRTYYRCAVDPGFDCPLGPAEAAAMNRGPTRAAEAKPRLPGDNSNDSSRINRARKAIGRALIEAESTTWPSVLPYLTADIQYNDPIVTIEGIGMMTEFLARFFAGSPDLVTTIEDEICIGGIYMGTWTMVGQFNGSPNEAKGMTIVKFRPGETQAYYQRDYYTEGDVMINIPGLDEPTAAFRTYYRCAVDPRFECPLSQEKADTAPPPAQFKLGQNAPNPFNPVTTIFFAVPAGGAEISLRVYDVAGRLVWTLVDGYEPGGARSVLWDGLSDHGLPVASGTYHCVMTGPSFSANKKMVLLK